MSILGRLFGGIFNRKKPETPASAPAPAPGPVVASADTPPTLEQVDIVAVLEALAAANPQKLNWRTSIVDLMKLVGMESTLAERRALADELGYAGDKSDTATMNIWLHKQVMARIQANGGQVPPELLD